MKQLSSSEFRIAYHKLTEPTQVIANGRIIGQWLPTVVTVMEPEQQFQQYNPVPKPMKGKRPVKK